MSVYFFSVRKYDESSPIQILWNAFGSNIPYYLPLEGGTGINYLFCIKNTKEVIVDTCNKHKYIINSGLTNVEIVDSMYNNMYTATISYTDPSYYVLKKLHDM
jgi:hypothetical protein